jgi:hypothetical protein
VMFLSPYPQGLLVLDDGWLFMQKPFLPKVLLERIEELMKKPAMPTTDRSHA